MDGYIHLYYSPTITVCRKILEKILHEGSILDPFYELCE
jgi:hypothetical protein